MSAARAPWRLAPVWAHWVGWFVARVLWNTQVVGKDRVPPRGPVVVAANHVHVLDGPLLIGLSPRPLHIFVKEEMFHGPASPWLRLAGQIRTDRANGGSALRIGQAVLRRGGAIGIFPEGSRGEGTVADARAGAAWLAVNGAAPVVPVAILGTRRPGESKSRLPALRRRFYVEFGEPFVIDSAGRSRREAISEGTEQIRSALAALVVDASARTGYVLPGPVDQGQ